MLSYDALCRHPDAFPSPTGLTRAEFERPAAEFEAAERAARRAAATARRDRRPPRHAPGAGRPYHHDARSRSPMAPVWLRTYPTCAVLGLFFGPHKRDAHLDARAALGALDRLDTSPFDRPGPDRRQLRSAAEALAAFPRVRPIIGAKEQRINRPGGFAAREPYSSGTKKARPLKTQVAADPRGRVEAISDSVPGGANRDLALLRASGVPGRWGEGEGAMVDKGYVGVKASHPHVPIIIPFEASRVIR